LHGLSAAFHHLAIRCDVLVGDSLPSPGLHPFSTTTPELTRAGHCFVARRFPFLRHSDCHRTAGAKLVHPESVKTKSAELVIVRFV